MNNENNNINQTDKFMPVNDINQINQPVNNNSEPVIQPVTEPVAVQPVTEPVNVQPSFQVPVVEPNLVSTPMTEPIQAQPVVAQPQMVTEPQVNTVSASDSKLVTDDSKILNENLKKVEIKDYTPPSKAKIILLIIFFIALILFIIFLPQISSMISNYKSGVNYQKQEEITTGKLVCTLSATTKELDKEYEITFDFTDKKTKKSKYIIITRGDSTTENSLDELNEKCNNLKKETDGLDGFSIKCDYTDTKLVETQYFNLETIDKEKLGAAFTEAGGILPTYEFNQDIDSIEKNMKASKYTCERQK